MQKTTLMTTLASADRQHDVGGLVTRLHGAGDFQGDRMTTLIDRIETALADGAWLKLPELLARMGEDSFNKSVGRQVRAVMSSTGEIISNSSTGYKLTRLASDEEIQHTIFDYSARADDLKRRALMVKLVSLRIQRPTAITEIPETIFGNEDVL